MKIKKITLLNCTCGHKPIMKWMDCCDALLTVYCPNCNYTPCTIGEHYESPYRMAKLWNKSLKRNMKKSSG